MAGIGKVERLGTERIGKLLLEMSAQTTFSLLVYAVYSITDTYFLSVGVNSLAAAGASIISPVFIAPGGVAVMVAAYFQSLGKAKDALLLTLGGMLLVKLPVLLLGARLFGLDGIWASEARVGADPLRRGAADAALYPDVGGWRRRRGRRDPPQRCPHPYVPGTAPSGCLQVPGTSARDVPHPRSAAKHSRCRPRPALPGRSRAAGRCRCAGSARTQRPTPGPA